MKIDFTDLLQKIAKIEALEARVAALEAENEKLRNEIRPASEWLTISEAADLLKVSATTIHRHCKGGDLMKYRDPAGNPRLKRSEVEGYYKSFLK